MYESLNLKWRCTLMEFQNMDHLKDVRANLPKHTSKNYKRHSIDEITHITIHHSGTKSGDAFSFAKYHVDHNDWPGIGYHFVILRNGEIQWTNDLGITSYHTGGRNTGNIGICLVGSGSFTKKQTEALIALIEHLKNDLAIPVRRIIGHKEHPNQQTVCPDLNMETVRSQVEANRKGENSRNREDTVSVPTQILKRGERGYQVKILQQSLLEAGERLPGSGADGIFGRETEEAVRNFQRRHGLQIDGITGTETYQKLREVLTKKSNILHKVQLGAFTSKENAEALSKKIRGKGYDTYIISE